MTHLSESKASNLTERSERGAAMTEYVLIVSLIAIVCITGLRLVGTTTAAKLNDVATQLQ